MKSADIHNKTFSPNEIASDNKPIYTIEILNTERINGTYNDVDHRNYTSYDWSNYCI